MTRLWTNIKHTPRIEGGFSSHSLAFLEGARLLPQDVQILLLCLKHSSPMPG